MINVEVVRGSSESVGSVLRRFTKRVQGSGVLPRVRSLRYNERELSKYKVKQKTLKYLDRKKESLRAFKLGLDLREKPSTRGRK